MSRKMFAKKLALATTCIITVMGLSFFVQYTSQYQHLKPISASGSVARRNMFMLKSIEKADLGTNVADETKESKSFLPDKSVVMFNVMPKSGSRTLYELVAKMNQTKNITIRNTMDGFNQTHAEKLQDIRRLIYSHDLGFLYTHMKFELFVKGNKKPKYISIVRDPIDRLASLYYFVRYGDDVADQSEAGQHFRERMEQMNHSSESFNEYVTSRGLSRHSSTATVRHFCGHDKICGKNNKNAYKNAVENINKQYILVGIMEDYVSTLKALEILIPDLFAGVTQIYLDQRKGILGKMRTKNKTTISPFVRRKLKEEMKMDYKLYDYLKLKFNRLKAKLNISD